VSKTPLKSLNKLDQLSKTSKTH